MNRAVLLVESGGLQMTRSLEQITLENLKIIVRLT